jgi:RING finger protein 113A
LIYVVGDEVDNPEGATGTVDDEENFAIDDDDNIPFACHICREPFKNPVVTLCGHYFCNDCIVNTYKNQSKLCPVCEKQTFGVFNRPIKLLKKLQQQQGNEGDSAADGSNKPVVAKPQTSRRFGSWAVSTET